MTITVRAVESFRTIIVPSPVDGTRGGRRFVGNITKRSRPARRRRSRRRRRRSIDSLGATNHAGCTARRPITRREARDGVREWEDYWTIPWILRRR